MKSNWQTKPISKCLQNIPKLGSLLRSDYLEDGKFPVIDQGQDFIAGCTNDDSLIFKDCLPVIIFGDHTRALKFINFPFAVGADGTKILKPIVDFDPIFFYYMLQSLDLESRGYARHFKLLKEQEIPLPPLATQHKIVAILGEKFAKLREAKRLRQEAIVDTEKILGATLREIFEEGNEKGWETNTLEEICEKITDGTHQTPTYYDGGYIFLSSKNVTTGKINWENIRYIDEKQHLEMYKRVTPKRDDILLAKNGTTGVAAIVDRDEVFDIYVSLALIRAKEMILPRFLLHFINSPLAKEQFNKRLKGAGVPNLHLKEIREVQISFPISLVEQQKIVTRLDALSEKLRTLRQLQQSQLDDMKKLEKAYLREAFRGELI